MIWELRCAKINSFASLVALDDADFQAGLFAADGSPQDWTHRPAVEFYVEPGSPFTSKRHKAPSVGTQEVDVKEARQGKL